jgi:hypothetical protein
MLRLAGPKLGFQDEGSVCDDGLLGADTFEDFDAAIPSAADRNWRCLESVLGLDEDDVSPFDLLHGTFRQHDRIGLGAEWRDANPDRLALFQPTWRAIQLQYDGRGTALKIDGRCGRANGRLRRPSVRELDDRAVAGPDEVSVSRWNRGFDLDAVWICDIEQLRACRNIGAKLGVHFGDATADW